MNPPPVCLEDLGWDAARDAEFQPLAQSGMIPGRVAVEDKHAFKVVTREGELEAALPGKIIRGPACHHPKVGDWIAAKRLPGEPKLLIHSLLTRRSKLVRKQSGREVEEQVLATNIDRVFAVQPLDERFNPRLLERHLVMAMEGGAQPVVVLNKADLCDNLERCKEAARQVAPQAELFVVSAKTRLGVRALRDSIRPGQTSVFLGASGVGKSSLVNRLYGESIQPTLEVRASDHKGRHTTSWRELILLPGGGLVIDTPGLREFHLWTSEEGLELAFPDIAEIALGCHFRDCSHDAESRCAVKEAVAQGRLDRGRFQSFLKLKSEAKAVRRDARSFKPVPGRRRKPVDDSWKSD